MILARNVAVVDIQVSVGSNFAEAYRYTDAEGAVIDTTGWTATSQIRRRARSTSPLVATPSVTAPDVNGDFTVTIDNSVTATLDPNDPRNPNDYYVWQIDLTNGSDTVRIVEGKCVVYPSVIH